jgi:hypothetical protein
MDVVSTKTLIRFRCPACGKINKAAPNAVGRSGACFGCGRVMKVPAPKRAATRAQVASRDARRRESLDALSPSNRMPPQIDLPVNDASARPSRQTRTADDSAEIPIAIPPASPPIEPSFAQRVAPLPTYADGDEPRRRSPVSRIVGPWLLHLTVPAAVLGVLYLLYGERLPSGTVWSSPTANAPINGAGAEAPEAIQVEYEVVVDATNRMQYVVRRLTATGPGTSVWIETRYTVPPPGFPAGAPVRIETSTAPSTTNARSSVVGETSLE